MNKKYEIHTLENGCFYISDNESQMNCVEIIERLNSLEEENKKLKKEKINGILDLISYSYPYYKPVNIISPFDEDNIYYRTSKQLKDYLIKNDFLVDEVSRISVGNKSYYHVEFNLSDDERDYDKTTDCRMRRVLDIKGVGLGDFYENDGLIHEIVLVDEKELNDKYLVNGNLNFGIKNSIE